MTRQVDAVPEGTTTSGPPIQDSSYRLKLGMAYAEAGLRGQALEVLATIPLDDSHYPQAHRVVMELYADAREDEALCRAAKAALEVGVAPYWPARYLGLVAYRQGAYGEAAHHFRQAMEYLPTNTELCAVRQGVTAGTRRPEVRALIREAMAWGLRPHSALDALAPLLWGGRAVTCSFEDSTTFFAYTQDAPQNVRAWYLALARSLYAELGITMSIFRFLTCAGETCALNGKLVFALDPAVVEAVTTLEAATWDVFAGGGRPEGSAEMLEREGSLLEYPACCTTWAAQARRAGATYEATALAALIEVQVQAAHGGASAYSTQPAYFAYEFYPCHPRCAAAEAVGRNLRAHYAAGDPRLGRLYTDWLLPFNAGKILRPTAGYRDYVRDLDAALFGLAQTPWERSTGWARRVVGRMRAVLPGFRGEGTP